MNTSPGSARADSSQAAPAPNHPNHPDRTTRLPQASRPSLRRLLPRVAVNAGLPLVVFAVVRSHVGSDVLALAIAGGVPLLGTLATFVLRRRLDVVGAIALVGVALALAISALSGGNRIVLELQDSLVTGPLGLVLLGSAAVGRPLHLVLLRILAARDPRMRGSTSGPSDPARRRTSTVFTVLLGSTLTAHAGVLLVLALSVPTGTFLALSRPVGLAVLAVGVGAMWWYRTRLRDRSS
ncbi:VC0807 family protein [Actinopolymorpha sp. NPDC004070]|uniref:VC0807 family protein n=1 Tax=Actinopolymorpha sp. NPDC004070 TaxID=3154548 RepID=UPI0033A49BAD